LKKVYHFYKKISAEKPMRYYEIDGFQMDMGEGHMLSLNQNNCPMYDRFVPFLGRLADEKMKRMGQDENCWIIDIGANVGDTVAGFIRHTRAEVVCVEPTKKFMLLLQKNIAAMEPVYSKRIHIVRAYIAQNHTENYVSSVVGGTAVKKKVEEAACSEAPTLTIPDLLQQEKILPEKLALVKVDTDGYDSECIMSFRGVLSQISPLLFWENQIDTDAQMNKFVEMVSYLADNSYTEFFVFDNFGNYLCCVDAENLKKINCYLGRILHQCSPRSFCYVDVLACKEGDQEMCRAVINEYVNLFDKGVLSTD
jgi:methyltransferase, fkbM family